MRPVLVLERAHARDAAGPHGRPRGVLAGVSLALGAGLHAVLGAPSDGTLALADLATAAGARPPIRGRVTVLSRDPFRTPFVRARIGALASEPRLPAAPTLRAAVRIAMRARGETGDRFDAVLDPLGLSPLQARDPRTLSFAEQRAVELALALSTPAPALLVLHEPLCEVALPRIEALHLRLREAAASGACVVVTTSSPADARALADHVLVLDRGLVARESRGAAALLSGDSITLHALVRVRHDGGDPQAPGSAGARNLCAALSQRPEVRAVSWRDASSPGEPAHVEVHGDAAEALAHAFVEAALASDADVESLTEAAPTLAQVRTATAVLLAAPRRVPPPKSPAPPAPSEPPPRDADPPPAPAPGADP